MTFGRVCLILLLGLGIALLLGCNKAQAPAPPAQPQAAAPPPPPPPPPDTSYGKLAKTERLAKVAVEAMTLNGIRNSEAEASKGHTFLTLHFEGKRCAAHGMVAMQSVGAEGVMARTDEGSWLTNEQGKKFTPGIPSAGKDSCAIAFEVPAEATCLIWHDGKKASYKLEPAIMAEVNPQQPAQAPEVKQ